MSGEEREADERAARGDLNGAERLLQLAARHGTGGAQIWVKLASIRRALGNLDGALAAIDEALRIDPLDFMALLSRGRLREARRERADAARDYLRALAQIPANEAVPAHLVAIVQHARAFGDAYRDEVEGKWCAAIHAMPDLDAATRQRAERFTSNALHRTRVFHSEPTHYHYPGLSEREFHDRADFPWLASLEAATDVIREEYLSLLRHGRGKSQPYVQYEAGLPVRQWAALNHSFNWTAFHLVQNGSTVLANADACPGTMAALAIVDRPHIVGRSPNAMFSLLKPRTRIPPHTGVANTRLVCHLPLIVPERCWFRVGAERRDWRVGEAFVFDDTIEHEAANDSDEPRVVLIFDVWHPQLAAAERTVVSRLMETGGLDDGSPI